MGQMHLSYDMQTQNTVLNCGKSWLQEELLVYTASACCYNSWPLLVQGHVRTYQ